MTDNTNNNSTPFIPPIPKSISIPTRFDLNDNKEVPSYVNVEAAEGEFYEEQVTPSSDLESAQSAVLPTVQEANVAETESSADVAPSLVFDNDAPEEEPSAVDSIYTEKDDDDAIEEKATINKYRKHLKQLSEVANATPLGTASQMAEVYRRNLEESTAVDPVDDLKCIISEASAMAITNAYKTFTKSLEKALKSHPDCLTDNVDGITPTGTANIFAMYKDTKSVPLRGKSGYLSLMGLNGTIRRINLFSSGLQLQIQAPTVGQLLAYQREIHAATELYGRTLGTPYYVFADAHLTDCVVNQLLPQLVVATNYAGDNDWEVLKEKISYQDYQAIMVTILSLMYPSGVKTTFTCGNPNCRHMETMNFDTSKLILVNRDLLNKEALAHLHIKSKVNDDQLAAYHKALNLEKTIEIKYDVNGTQKHWTLELRQCSLAQYTNAAQSFMDELKAVKFKNVDQASTYVTASGMRMMRPWISKITGHFVQGDQELDIVINNDNTDHYTDMSIDEVLKEWHLYCPHVRNQIVDYILDTRISHVAFYYPKCTACGTATSSGYGGYIPYDAQTGFFNLNQLLIMRLISQNSTDIDLS